jgi:hypothetical protein
MAITIRTPAHPIAQISGKGWIETIGECDKQEDKRRCFEPQMRKHGPDGAHQV